MHAIPESFCLITDNRTFMAGCWRQKEKRCQLYQLSHHWNLMWNYGIGWHIQKEQDEKSSLAKNQLVTAKRWGNTSTLMLRWLHTNPSKTALDQSRPMLEGFIWSHLSITMLMSPSQSALTGLFLASENFSSGSFWIR